MSIIVYHGSIQVVPQPLTQASRPSLDFGQGFYITDLREQAINWATRLANTGRSQWLNTYELDIDRVRAAYRCLRFDTYNRDWLDFVVNSRRGKEPWKAYDFIEGGVANDRVVVAVELYFRRQISVKRALGMLAHHEPNNQICLLSQSIIDECLRYVGSEPLNAEASISKKKGEPLC